MGPAKPVSQNGNGLVSRIAIVGGGPKGMYGLERLMAELKATRTFSPSVDIHIFNRTPFFGAGDIYRTDQPDYLLMNFSNGHIDLWSRSPPAPLVSPALNLADWHKIQELPGVSADPRDYSARAVTGAYLAEGFKAITKACPDGVTLHTHVAEVRCLRSLENAYAIRTSSEIVNQAIGSLPFHWVLVCTGHPRHEPDAAGRALRQFDDEHPGAHYIDFVYPVTERLRAIPPDTHVAIQGLGLTFMDTVLALTEGRGGRFAAAQNGRLRYLRSGREPAVLLPYSRSGLPMIPRGVTYGLPARELKFFNRSNLPRNGPVDFERHIWPLLRMDMLLAYYSVVFRKHGLTYQRGDAAATLQSALPFASDRFDPNELFQPFAATEDLHAHTLDFLRHTAAGAEEGELKSPLIAAAAVWRHATPLFSEIYQFGGLTAASHRSFLAHYAGHFNRLAFGPPVVNMHKIIAVAEAGLLDFSFTQNPAVKPDEGSGLFILQRAGKLEVTRHCDALIDARIPKTCLHKDASPFYRNLLESREVRAFTNAAFSPGCVYIDPAGNAIGKNGCTNERLTFYGTPTEGVTWDNDTLSRSHNDFASGWARRVARRIAEIS